MKKTSTVRDQFMKNFFLKTMDQIGTHIHTEKQRKGSFHFYSIGAFFRMAFRKYLPGALKKIPRELIHEANSQRVHHNRPSSRAM